MQSEDSSTPDKEAVSVEVENVGGIDHCEISLEPGGTILTGRNATNRTSVLSAIAGVLGGETATLKSDADEGGVVMELGTERYERTYERTGSGVRVSGNPYTDEGTLVDTFVALLESNPARRAVERGDDLRDVLMRPVDTDAIEAEIDELRQALREHDDNRERTEHRRSRLPRLRERRRELETAIEDNASKLDELREEVAVLEADSDASGERAEMVGRLDRHRQQLREREEELEVARAELDALEDDIENIEAELEEIPDVSSSDITAVEEDLEAARERRRTVEEALSALTTIVEFNEDLLADGSPHPAVAGDVTDELAPAREREVSCWTCGSRVRRGAITDRLDDLRDHARGLREELAECRDEIGRLEDRRGELVGAVDSRESLQSRRSATRERIGEREGRIEELADDIETLRADIVEIEDAVADAGAVGDGDVLETYERISELEYERGQHRQALEDVESEIAEIEALPDSEKLAERRSELQGELERNRRRMEELEATAVSAFNDHMDELLHVLEYENVARVWIERKPGEGGGESTFDLHVVRESDDAVYEDRIENLSESEREVIGLVVALSGFLIHEVYETVPFMLLDSLEAIDAERIATIVDYYTDFAPYLVVALLTEDATAVAESHRELPARSLT